MMIDLIALIHYFSNSLLFMHVILYIVILIVTFVIMEGVTWLTHRHVMHGFLWHLHKDHHQVEPGFFEKNDLFFVIFAIPAILLIYFGTYTVSWWLQPIGFGITAYGFAYFLVHDIIIHQRFKLFTRSSNSYIRAIRWAHKMHHKHLGKYHGESYGMLLPHPRYVEKIRRDNQLFQRRERGYERISQKRNIQVPPVNDQ